VLTQKAYESLQKEYNKKNGAKEAIKKNKEAEGT
jgi:hypothetical protein